MTCLAAAGRYNKQAAMVTLDCARGARRSCAAGVVANSLYAADVVAVIAEPPAEPPLVAALTRELQARRDTRVLPAHGDLSEWLEVGYRGFGYEISAHLSTDSPWKAWAHADPCIRRSVLLWHGVDECIQRDEERFTWLARLFADNITEPQPEIRAPVRLHKAVLIGGEALEHHLEALAAALPDDSRFRYVIVQ